MDTPFQWTKQVASHFGGTRNGMCLSWPKRITARGEIRSQFHHVIDIVPTILEAAGMQAPAGLNGVPQKPIEGVSMAYTFDDAKAPTRHTTQYFEIVANRGLYQDGWIASTTPLRPPWVVTVAWSPTRTTSHGSSTTWRRTSANQESGQARIPRSSPNLQARFLIEAAKYNVLPIDFQFRRPGEPGTASRLQHGTDGFRVLSQA